jgi:hypothetical protein
MSPLVTRIMFFANFNTHLKYGLIVWSGDIETKSTF